jgi:hypothetical protein
MYSLNPLLLPSPLSCPFFTLANLLPFTPLLRCLSNKISPNVFEEIDFNQGVSEFKITGTDLESPV